MNINDIKTIVLDIDGTLINSQGEISPKTEEAIKEIQDREVHIVLASGRPFQSMVKIANKLDLDKNEGVIVCNNGALGYDTKNEEIIFETPIDHDLLLEIFEEIKGRPIVPVVDKDEFMLTENIDDGILEYKGERLDIIRREARYGGFTLKEVDDLTDYIDHNINKLLTIVAPEKINETIGEFKKIFENKLHVVQTSPYFMEFVMPHVSKAYGLEKLGIDHETMMTFGDSMNDREMLKMSKYPIAMGNALGPVKDVAFYVTDTNDNEGIYKALKHFDFIN